MMGQPMSFLPEELLKKRIHVIGMTGAEGAAIARFLATEGASDVTLHDFASPDDLRLSFDRFHEAHTEAERETQFNELIRLPFQARIGKEVYLDGIAEAELVFVPQAWFRYPQNAVLKELQGKIPFWNITKLYAELAPCRVLAVSGTSGKSTTVRLLYEMCNAGGRAWFSGNDRLNVQLLDRFSDMQPEDLFVLEVSNRQLLIDFDKPFSVAGLTNLQPNHLDDHGTFEAYVAVKRKLFAHQRPEDIAVLNADDPVLRTLASDLPSRVVLFSLTEELSEGAYLHDGNLWIRSEGRSYLLCAARDVKLPGPHNLANILMAALMAFLVGIDTKTIRNVAVSFRGVPHRLEPVATVRGVSYVEDSAGCNPDNPRMAVQSFPQPIVLLAGGGRPHARAGDFLDMMRAVRSARMRAMILYGPAAEQMEREYAEVRAETPGQTDIPVEHASTMREAFVKCVAFARHGDVVVLSPGCESFGEFRDYRERAQVFHQLVAALEA